METLTCGHAPSEHSSFATGYGSDNDGNTYCYDCCADRERASMTETGSATLCLVESPNPKKIGSDGTMPDVEITDWAGKLRFRPGTMRKGQHNMARTRTDVWFRGPDGREWHGVQYGENSQVLHCKRSK